MSKAKVKLSAAKTLLVLGPLPPPVGGATRTLQLFLEEAARWENVEIRLINVSPSDYRRETAVWRWSTFRRAVIIIGQFLTDISRCDAVLLFGRATLLSTVGALLLTLNLWFKKPFFMKPTGGDLDVFLSRQKSPMRQIITRLLGMAAGIFGQTRQMNQTLAGLGLANLYYLPGYRAANDALPRPRAGRAGQLRLIFLSQIKEEKGTLVLLDALARLAQDDSIEVWCDFYGPIFTEDRAEFLAKVAQTPRASYRGVVDPAQAVSTIAEYDALVLPTYFINEGHPGVIIEAMQAGIPVISTDHRAIGELIVSEANGLLVPPRDPAALGNAIKRLAVDVEFRQRLGRANYQRRCDFQADVLVPKMLDIIFSTER